MKFMEKNWIFSKSVKVANLPYNAYKWYYFHKIVFFYTRADGFFAEAIKLFNLEKLSKFAEDSIFSKKRFNRSKRYLQQI